MKSGKTPRVAAVAAVLAVGGGIVAWHHAGERAAAEEAVTAAMRERTAAQAETQALEARVAALRRDLAALVRPAKAEPVQKPAASTRPLTSVLAPAALARDVQDFRQALPLDYATFYRQAELLPAQVRRLEDILAEHEGRERDVRAIATEQRLRDEDPAIASLLSEEAKRHEAALREFLGEARKGQFDEYRAALPERRAVGQLTASLVFTDSPLTAVQTQALAEALRESRSRGRLEDSARWEPVLARAETLLNARQLAELQAQAAALRNEAAMDEVARLVAARARQP